MTAETLLVVAIIMAASMLRVMTNAGAESRLIGLHVELSRNLDAVLFGSLVAWVILRYTSRWNHVSQSLFVAGLTAPIFVTLTPLNLLMQQLV